MEKQEPSQTLAVSFTRYVVLGKSLNLGNVIDIIFILHEYCYS